MPTIHSLDLNFQGVPGTIASYLVPHAGGGVLIESGPGSTTGALTERLAEHDLAPEDITDVLVTHIHLDHAGAAGWLAERGATVHAHHVGAPHLADPGKLLKSARRIYGDDMDRLWGETLPVPEKQLNVLHDGDTVEVGDVGFEAVETVGHAYHHVAYLLDGTCFTGDVAGVRLDGARHVTPPLPPPEIDLDRWLDSLERLREAGPERLALTHFGVHDDVAWHLGAIKEAIREARRWTAHIMTQDLSDEELRERVTTWLRERAVADGLSDEEWQRYETANPSWMAAAGLRRYWAKHAGA